MPRDFFRGEYSRRVRGYLFKEGAYSLRYVVKSTKEMAFSERAFFRDFLVVLQKGNTQAKCAFVYLKKRLSEISMREALGIPITVRLLDEGKKFEDESIFVTWKDQQKISTNWQDLGHLVAFNTQAGERLLKFYRRSLSIAEEKLVSLGKSRTPIVPVIRGFEHGGENLQSLLYIVRPLSDKRLTRSALILASDNGEKVVAASKESKRVFEVPLSSLKRGLKTSAYVPWIDIGGRSDYVILKPFEDFDEIVRTFGVKQVDFLAISKKAGRRFTHLVLNRRFNLTAPGTRALAFFSEESILPVGAHWSILLDSRTSQAMCLWFNSSFYLAELLLLHTETGGSYMLITKEQVHQLHVPNLAKCDINDLLEAFEQVRYAELPPLVQQFENPPEARQIIDHAVLKVIGYTDKEISELLPDLYSAMATEMRSLQELMRRSTAKGREPSLQLHLLPSE